MYMTNCYYSQSLMGRRVGQILALIVLPVQDLATQVYSVLKTYSATTGLRVHLSTGALSLTDDRTHLLRHRKFLKSYFLIKSEILKCKEWVVSVCGLSASLAKPQLRPGKFDQELYT